MSTCSNCYNGCAETISDQCVKYTGIDVPALGISTGDNLLSVENAITNFLVPAINGTGIKPIIDPNIICNIVKSYLPACTTCTGFTLNEILTAIIKTVCDLQVQITTNTNAISTLNADYTIGCLTGVTASSDTHNIVQATINNLCSLNTAFSTLVSQLNLINVTSLNVDDYITEYLDNQPSTNLASAKMVPYAPIAYFGPLSNYPATGDSFDVSGAGQNYWNKVYLCNGANPGVPDLRGWTLVGVTTGMFGGTLNPIVDPAASPNNPNYTITGPGSLQGATAVTLGVGEIPNHTHIATVTINDPKHTHKYTLTTAVGGSDDTAEGTRPNLVPNTLTSAEETGLKGTGAGQNVFVTNSAIGSGDAHSNIQPSKGCYYIIYIP